MIRLFQLRAAAFVMMAVLAMAAPAHAQGRGHGKEKAASAHAKQQDHAKNQARGKQNEHARKQAHAKQPGKADRGHKIQQKTAKHVAKSGKAVSRVANKSGKAGKAHKFSRVFTLNDIRRPRVKNFAKSERATERLAAGALARAYARGAADGLFLIAPVGNLVRISNNDGAVLLELDEGRARNLGAWNVRPLNDEIRSGSPAFCRSGAGHPVWGRQWCIDKGFGLGSYGNVRWGDVTDGNDVVFINPVSSGDLARDALLALLGQVAFDRLALHAVTLGYAEPITGVWVNDNTGARLLRVNSGSYPVAEIVDTNRDNRADMLVFALQPW